MKLASTTTQLVSHLDQETPRRLEQCQHLIGLKLLFKISKHSQPLANPNEWIFP